LEGLPARNEDEAIAYKILARALEEPMRAIVKNAGYVPDVIIEKVKASPKGYGFEARSGKIADMKQAGILDASLTVQNALKIAVGGAAMTLTTDVIVLHKKPVETIVP
jgi:chaperonin GroEL